MVAWFSEEELTAKSRSKIGMMTLVALRSPSHFVYSVAVSLGLEGNSFYWS
jgi:Cu2+-exporting ATPase